MGDLQMKPNEIEVDGYYVKRGGGIIRHFYGLTSRGKACYRTYDQHTGDYIHTCTCSTESLFNWAERKATSEEISRLPLWKEDSQASERRSRPLRNALRATKGG